MFVALALMPLYAGISPAYRTIIARMVSKAETARVFALLSLVMVVSPVVAKAGFNTLYEDTLATWPGLVFAVMALCHVLVLLTQLLVYALMHPLWAARQRHEEAEAAAAGIRQRAERRSTLSDVTATTTLVANGENDDDDARSVSVADVHVGSLEDLVVDA